MNKSKPPIIAFFGTKGGVGKTTLTTRFAEMLTLAEGKPKVLLIDLDVDHRGLTITLTNNMPFGVKTIHDYVNDRNKSLDKLIYVNEIVGMSPEMHLELGGGDLYLIPAATADSKQVFQTGARIDPDELYDLLNSLIEDAIGSQHFDAVLIDCGPVINNYTAAATHLADRAFIIGQNEPISFESLRTYAFKIREFYPDFALGKMNIILNKVRNIPGAKEKAEATGVFAIIPFSDDVVDVTEGLTDIPEWRDKLFDSHVHSLVERIMLPIGAGHLVPKISAWLPSRFNTLLEKLPQLTASPSVRRIRYVGRLLMTLGALLIVASLVIEFGFGIGNLGQVFAKGSQTETTSQLRNIPIWIFALVGLGLTGWGYYSFERQYQRLMALIGAIAKDKEVFVLKRLQTAQGRRQLDQLTRLISKLPSTL